MNRRSHCLAWAAAGLLTGCAPALDWREVRPEAGGITLLFPCKPDHQTRRLPLAGAEVRLVLHACNAGGATFALAFADVGDPVRVGPALAELEAATRRNLSADAAETMPLKLEGATPNAMTRRSSFSGRMPDGRAAVGQTAVFTKGTRVYQATMLGERANTEAADTFFGNLRLGP
jgi:hypothetical protein